MIHPITAASVFDPLKQYWFYSSRRGGWNAWFGSGFTTVGLYRPMSGAEWLSIGYSHFSESVTCPTHFPVADPRSVDLSHEDSVAALDLQKLITDHPTARAGQYQGFDILTGIRLGIKKGRELQSDANAAERVTIAKLREEITKLKNDLKVLAEEDAAFRDRSRKILGDALKDRDAQCSRANVAESCVSVLQAQLDTAKQQRDYFARHSEQKSKCIADLINRNEMLAGRKPGDYEPNAEALRTERDALRIECNSLRTKLHNVQVALKS